MKAKQILLGLMLIASTLCAQALTLEEVMRNPSVQALLNRQFEIQPLVNQCKDARFNTQNLDRCNVARQAQMVSSLPPEMRAIAQNPRSAQALRSLCINSNPTERASNYLCQELVRADGSFGAEVAAKAALEYEQTRDRP